MKFSIEFDKKLKNAEAKFADSGVSMSNPGQTRLQLTRIRIRII